MKHKLIGLVLVLLASLTGSFMTGPLLAADADKINLRLFGKSALKGYQGCSFALWQRNRNPQKDKFAYVFYVRFFDAHPMPALVKIGKKVLELEKVEIGIENSGLTDKFQIYRDAKKTTTLLIEIRKTKQVGDDTKITEARLTFIQPNKHPFGMTVKGGFSCQTTDGGSEANSTEEPKIAKKKARERTYLPPNLDSNAVRLGKRVNFSKLSQVPQHVLQVVRENGEACNINNVAGAGSKYAISDAMTLWVVPCDLFASNSSVMLVTALNGTKHAIGLEIPRRPGSSDGEPGYDMAWPLIHPRSGVVVVSSMGRRGDCGTMEYYQLIVAEGESVELKLLEVREKNDCDGVKVRPQDLPLVYRAK